MVKVVRVAFFAVLVDLVPGVLLAQYDLGVTAVSGPGSMTVGVSGSFVVSLFGTGGGPTGVTVTAIFTRPVTFNPGASTPGCAANFAPGDSTTVSCPATGLGNVAINVTPQIAGTLWAVAGIIGNEVDPDMTNNSKSASVSVTAPANAATFVSQSVPPSVVAGFPFSATVTMRNSGTTTWTETGGGGSYRLGSVAVGDPWGGRIYLNSGESIGPGQQKTFTINATAPSTPGSYPFQWRMVDELVEWFGDTTPLVNVVVTAPANGATFVSQSVPASVVAGSPFTATVTMINSGQTTWTAAGNYRLGELVVGNPWGGRAYLGPSDSIAPGQQKTFTISVTAPYAAGAYSFQWRMLQELVEWFGDVTPSTTVTVTPAPLIAYSVTPCRVADTRGPVGDYGGPALSANILRLYQMRGVCGVPSTAKAVMVSFVIINPSTAGYLQLYPANAPAPGTSSMNFSAGWILANNAVVTLDTSGRTAVYPALSGGSVDFLLDVTGYLQ